jgi:hypothetical protein
MQSLSASPPSHSNLHSVTQPFVDTLDQNVLQQLLLAHIQTPEWASEHVINDFNAYVKNHLSEVWNFELHIPVCVKPTVPSVDTCTTENYHRKNASQYTLLTAERVHKTPTFRSALEGEASPKH